MGSPVSKLLCLAVLAVAPACLGEDTDHTQPVDIVVGSTKIHVPVDVLNGRPEVLPPKPRVRPSDVQVPQNSDYVEEVAGNSGIVIEPIQIRGPSEIQPIHITTAADITPIHITTAADIQPVVLLLHHFDADGVEHISVLDEKTLRGE